MEEAKRLTIAQCKKILEGNGDKYSDEQVKIIREVLYRFGELDYLIFKQMRILSQEDENQVISEKAA